ncbi:fibronectin type III domain-containing protein [Flavobacterium foetidum]|uniref:fibronectin type III domain-containing protein n=1 Tax=Flavobacterium foetidum TaxID=2026681 RepID=UPI0010756872|nr:fibronectin type III domain-containing protein [Flavobacterium foetidum]KAF2517833.1 hypothetical protein E0W73_01095 [Flavobacterium foetidum]
MLKKLQFQLFLTLGFWLSAIVSGIAQTYPVTISTQITQPSPIYLSNYADASTINSPIKVQIALNDLTISNRQIRLKCYFQGQSTSLMTNDFVVGAHDLFLEGGVPLQLTNVDLAPYFQYQNLLGINPNQYAQALPEGIYTFSVEVYDFATNKKLSKKTSVTTIIFQNDPPFLNLPLNNASIMQQNIQNIIFSWTPRQINVSNVEYEFSLVEIWDKYTPIQNAFAYSPPLFTTTTRSTTLQYGVSEPQLIPGKRYAWRVKAKALLGAEEIGVFKNNGFSEIYSFDYEVFCTAPLAINVEGISENQAKVTWSGNLDNFDYQVNYRQKNADSEWYKIVTPRESVTISNLKPNTTYEYSVGASCDVGKYTHSTVKEFQTLVRDEIAFQGCGIKPDPADLANTSPLAALFPNDVIAAGDFPVVVLHATGSNGTFSGDGYVTFPFLEKFRKLIDAADALAGKDENGESKGSIGENTRIRITFNNIGLNTDFKLISGEIIASYDAEWKGMIDGDQILTDVFGSDGKPIEGTLDYVVKSATLNPDGTVTIKGENGEVTTLAKSPYERVFTDKDGKTVTIPANGKGEPTISQGADGGKAVASNTNGVSSSGEVTQVSSKDVVIKFSNSLTETVSNKYAYDKMPANGAPKILQTYETIPMAAGGNYNVDYKAVSDLFKNHQEVVYAEATFKNGKSQKDIIFKTSAGEKVDFEWKNETQAEIKLTKKFEFGKYSIIATVKGKEEKNPQDSTKTVQGKSEIAGKINVWDLTQKPAINVTFISINGANTPDASVAKKELNEIYNKVGIQFEVTTQKVTIGTLPNEIKCGDSGVFDFYTDDQNSIIAQIESNTDFKYNDKTYYVLYTGKAGQNAYKGFMPLGGQYAFVFSSGDLRTAAHELGHGIFGLKHPFSNSGESGKTDLLMDYGSGTVLSHNDWDVIHSGGWKFYGFQKSSSGGLLGGFAIAPDWSFVSSGDQNAVRASGDIDSKGFLRGIVTTEGTFLWKLDSDGKYKYLHETSNKIYSNPTALPKEDSSIYLFFENQNTRGKYMHTKYKELLAVLKSRKESDLSDFISKHSDDDSFTRGEKEDRTTYWAYVGCKNCNSKGQTNGNGNDEERLKDLISKLDAKIGDDSVASEMIILDKNDPKYQEKLAEALKKVSYILATYDSSGKETLKLEYKLQIPKTIQDMFPNFKTSDNCMVDYINSSLTTLHENSIYKNMKPADQAMLEIATVFYQGFFGMWYCATNEESIANAGGVEQFLAGATHEAIAMIDVVLLVDGLATLAKEGLKTNLQGYIKYYENLKSVGSTITKGGQLQPEQILGVVLIPPYNTLSETIKKAISIGTEFKKTYFTECNKTILKGGKEADICYYRYGQLTVMIIPILYTAGEYAVAKLAKFSKISSSLAKNAVALNDKLIAKGVSLLEADGKTLIKNATTGEIMATVESKALKDIEKALDDLSDLNSAIGSVGKVISMTFENAPIKGSPISGGVIIDDIGTPIKALNNNGYVIKNNAFTGYRSSVNGNLAHELEEFTHLKIVKEGEIYMPKLDPVKEIISEAKDIPVIQLVPYKTTYYASEKGVVELIIAESASAKGVAQVVYTSAVVAKKLKEEEEKKEKCTICPERSGNTRNSQICRNLEQLLKNTSNLTAISKLCAIADLNNVLVKLLSYDIPVQKAFLQDIDSKCDNNKSLCVHISGIDEGIIVAWKSIIDNASIGTAFAKDWDVLQIVKDIINTPSKMAAFGPFEKGTIRNFDEFLNTYMACTPCNTCDTPAPGSWPSRFPKLDAVLKNSVEVYGTHKTTPDFLSSFYCGEVLAKNAINKKDGGQFMLRYMAENNITDHSQMIDRKFEYINPNAVQKQKEFDIFLGKGNIDGVWFIECKSYEETTPIDVNQLKAYFSSIDKVVNLNYVFNINKMITEAAAKEAVQALLCNKAEGTLKDNGNELFEVIWNNNALCKSLFGNDIDKNNPQDKLDSKNEFKTYILTLSDNFYKFIKVY